MPKMTAPEMAALVEAGAAATAEHLLAIHRSRRPDVVVDVASAMLKLEPLHAVSLELTMARSFAQRDLDLRSDARFCLEAELLPLRSDPGPDRCNGTWFDTERFESDEAFRAAPNLQLLRRERVAVLPDVGIVEFDHALPLVLEGSLSPPSIHRRGAPVRTPENPRRLDAAVLIRFQSASNYFHSLVDLAEVIYATRKVTSLPIVVGSCMRGPVEALVDLLAIADVIFADSDLTVDHAFLARVDRRWDDLGEMRDEVRQAIGPYDGDSLYISRADSNNRPLDNEQEIAELFESYGYRTVVPTELTVLEQWTAAVGADRIAGPHGAGLANAIFSRPSCRIIEMTHPHRHDLGYSSLAHRLDFEHHLIDGVTLPQPGFWSWRMEVGAIDPNVISEPVRPRVQPATPALVAPATALTREHSGSNRVADAIPEGVLTTRVIGNQRSGNHAIIEWILRNGDPGCDLFINSATITEGRLRQYGSAELPLTGTIAWSERIAPTKLLELVRAEGRPGSHLIISHENKAAQAIWPGPDSADDPMAGVFDRDIVILRSFFNWFASCHRLFSDISRGGNHLQGIQLDMKMLTLVQRWVEYTTIVLDGPEGDHQQPIIHVDYDRWCSDEQYRLELLDTLNLEVRDNSRDQLARETGSSFDGKDVVHATELKLDERWRWIGESGEASGILDRCLLDESVRFAIDRYHGQGTVMDMERKLADARTS